MGCAVLDGKLWVTGGVGNAEVQGSTNEVWYSEDGVTWQMATAEAAFPARNAHISLTFDNKIWVIGGQADDFSFFGDVWYSSNGIVWNVATAEAAFSARAGHAALVHEFDSTSKMWVIGGNSDSGKLSDVWYSTNGIDWTAASEPMSDFERRMSHTAVTFDEKIWVVGGATGSEDLSDVWTSFDGVDWGENTFDTPLPARSTHAALVYGGRIWVIAGTSSNPGVGRNDVWSYEDGTNWVRAQANAAFSVRYGMGYAVFNDKLWVIGADGTADNDVWYSPVDE